ncbi:peptidogalycan biosysnthesis protein [Saccharopolyspora sp. K220]|uniref:peptidogalycan biosysnthesis protein n=1 Tax=Saccharopolyspora soli TaxID=2926618 RepID=UPI001F580EC0|nr:peptidogalycan biosysnthesis protein [Saccharopolyspora soli]MCI2422508.1 peptidogalycan biosysnthesis protein [Saccharopolyspora soli]
MTSTQTATRVVDATADVPETDWDRLNRSGDLFCRHAWLRHLDHATDRPHRAVLTHDGTTLIGALPFWEGEHDDALFSLPDFFPDIPGHWKQHPFTWLGTRRSTCNGLLAARNGHRANTLAHLLTTALDVATAEGRGGVIMPYLPVTAAKELATAHPAARMLLHSADTTVHVPPDGANALFRQARRHNQQRRRAELRDFARAGHTLEWTDLTPAVTDAVAPLIAATRRKHGNSNSNGTAWMRRVFAAQRDTGLLDDAKAVLCLRHGQLAFATICYRHAATLYARYFGADDTAPRTGSPYFVMNFHALVDYAANEGLRRVHLSVSSLEAKVRRGARLDPLAAVVVPAHDDIDEHLALAHNHRFAQEILHRFTDYRAAMSDDWLSFLPEFPRTKRTSA